MKESVQEFIDREIWPERFEKKDYEFTKLCMQKPVSLVFWCFSPRKLRGNGYGFCIYDVGL